MIDFNDKREKDIQELCHQVLITPPILYFGSRGETSTCPFCRKSVDYDVDSKSDLPHDKNCAYLIAKDLTTNLR